MRTTAKFTIFLLIISLQFGCTKIRHAHDPYCLAPTSSCNAKKLPCPKKEEIEPITKPPKNQELSLAELIDIALINNPITKKSWAEARSIAAKYGKSLSSYLPEADFNGTYMRSRQTFFNETTPNDEEKSTVFYQTVINPEANISYTLFDFGQRKHSTDSAREALFAADWQHNQTLQTVIEYVMTDYYDYLYQIEAQKAFVANLENAASTLDSAKKKYNAGIAAVGDVAQAKTQYLQSEINLVEQKNALDVSFTKLAKTLGLPANDPFEVQQLPQLNTVHETMREVDLLIDKALNQRNDYLSAIATLRSNQSYLAYTRSLVRPKVTSSFVTGHKFYNRAHEREDYHFTLEFGLKFPLFKGFFYKNNIKEALAEVDGAKAQLEEVKLSLIQEITQSHIEVKTAEKTINFTTDYLEAALERYDIAIASYKVGTVTILDVLAAQSSLADARTKKARSQKNWYTSLASLAYSTGSLCNPENHKGVIRK